MPYDEHKAGRVVDFVQCLRHTKGEFHGKPFALLPWQEKIVRDVFGTVREENPDMRQYSQVYIEIGKKNGKQLSLDTPIPTSDGWKSMGELQVGDTVFDEAGQACHALPWIAPTGAQDMYKSGEYMVYTDREVYKCLQDTAYSPTDYAQAWQAV